MHVGVFNITMKGCEGCCKIRIHMLSVALCSYTHSSKGCFFTAKSYNLLFCFMFSPETQINSPGRVVGQPRIACSSPLWLTRKQEIMIWNDINVSNRKTNATSFISNWFGFSQTDKQQSINSCLQRTQRRLQTQLFSQSHFSTLSSLTGNIFKWRC